LEEGRIPLFARHGALRAEGKKGAAPSSFPAKAQRKGLKPPLGQGLQEGLGIGVEGPLEEGLGLALLHHLPGIKDHHLLGQGLGKGEVMGHKEKPHPRVQDPGLLKKGDCLILPQYIYSLGRLVGKDQSSTCGQSSSH
jgi:hypothetical protein